jgi:hypothetical protein
MKKNMKHIFFDVPTIFGSVRFFSLFFLERVMCIYICVTLITVFVCELIVVVVVLDILNAYATFPEE